jgi:hypothetical protein
MTKKNIVKWRIIFLDVQYPQLASLNDSLTHKQINDIHGTYSNRFFSGCHCTPKIG